MIGRLHRYLLTLLAVLFSIPATAIADCQAKLAEIDKRMEATSTDVRVLELAGQVRDQAADACSKGNEATAMQMLAMLEMMLGGPPGANADTASPGSPAPARAGPAKHEDPSMAMPDHVAPSSYPSRWDRLAAKAPCEWLSAEEIEKALGLTVSLRQRREPARCNYVFEAPNGWMEKAFSLYVEVHDDLEYLRRNESTLTRGVSGKMFTPFDPGAPDLNVYVSKKGTYLYAYPDNGSTLWRLGYLEDSPEKNALFAATTPPDDLGKRFMELLVQKYGDQL